MFCVSLMRTYFLLLAAEWNVIFNYFKTKCMCVYIGYVLLTAGAHGGKKHWNPSELKLQAIVSHLMWALVLKFGFAARVVCAVNH